MDNQNNLPSSINGDGRKFISLLKNYLKELTATVEDIYTVLGVDNDKKLEVEQFVRRIKIEEKKVNGNISLIVSWSKDEFTNYAGANIYIKESKNFTETEWDNIEISRNYATSDVTSFTIENCRVGRTYWIMVRGRNKLGALSTYDKSPSVTHYISEVNHTPPAPYDFQVVFDKRGCYWSWKQEDNNDYQWTELRLDEYVGEAHNRLDITKDVQSFAIPPERTGVAYLFNKGIGDSYTSPITLSFLKAVPPAPDNITVTPLFEGLAIKFATIPEDCQKAVVYINNEPHYTNTNEFMFQTSTGKYQIEVAFIDVFGEGEKSTPIIQTTLEEIPPNAVHITDNTVFDNGVIIGKYIGDKQIVGTKIQDGEISTSKLSANAITSDKIAANAITSGKIATGAVTTDTMEANSIHGSRITAGTLSADKIEAESITSEQIASGTITSDKIQVGAITSDTIGVKAITANKLDVESLSSITANIGDLTGGTITGTIIQNADKSFVVDEKGNIKGANIVGSRIDAESIYQAGFHIKNIQFSEISVAHGTILPIPVGYSANQCYYIPYSANTHVKYEGKIGHEKWGKKDNTGDKLWKPTGNNLIVGRGTSSSNSDDTTLTTTLYGTEDGKAVSYEVTTTDWVYHGDKHDSSGTYHIYYSGNVSLLCIAVK